VISCKHHGERLNWNNYGLQNQPKVQYSLIIYLYDLTTLPSDSSHHNILNIWPISMQVLLLGASTNIFLPYNADYLLSMLSQFRGKLQNCKTEWSSHWINKILPEFITLTINLPSSSFLSSASHKQCPYHTHYGEIPSWILGFKGHLGWGEYKYGDFFSTAACSAAETEI